MTSYGHADGLDPVVPTVATGAAIAVVSVFLAWATVSVGGMSVTAKGISGWEGKTIIAVAALMVVGAFAQKNASRNLGPLIVIGGLIIAGIAFWDFSTANEQVVAVVAKQGAAEGMDLAQAESIVRQAIASGELRVSLQTGIYIAMLGGLIGAAGGVVAWMGLGRSTTPIAIAPTPMFETYEPGTKPAAPAGFEDAWVSSAARAPQEPSAFQYGTPDVEPPAPAPAQPQFQYGTPDVEPAAPAPAPTPFQYGTPDEPSSAEQVRTVPTPAPPLSTSFLPPPPDQVDAGRGTNPPEPAGYAPPPPPPA